jgi:signal peptidase I
MDFAGAFMRPPISFPRWIANTFVLLLCVLLILHTYGIEAFVVPTGSMAPALAGHHRAAVCPRCGFRVLVGRHGADPDSTDETGGREATCPNCDSALDLDVPEATGDHILVNKSVFLLRRPRRWEIVVFRLLGKVFVKRLIGLPGEWIVIEDGDVYIDHVLARKTLEEFKQMRILVFDNQYQPAPSLIPLFPASAGNSGFPPSSAGESGRGEGWAQRWQFSGQDAKAPDTRPAELQGADLYLAGQRTSERYCWLTYRNASLDTGKVLPLADEYAYNGSDPSSGDVVHDFMVECDVEVLRGNGQVGLGITDGQDALLAELPVMPEGTAVARAAGQALPPQDVGGQKVLAESACRLVPGHKYHVELAFVDRRLTLRLDGDEIFGPVDLPSVTKRQAVTRPVSLGARGVDAVFRNVRLYRDLHYTQAGRQGVRGKAVHLDEDQYFVMGDNSPNSEDSRFWPDQGRVPGASLIGKPFLVHLPSRVASGLRLGRFWQCQLPDWTRVRWLR